MSKKPAPQDWHRADIKAALAKAGWTLSALSRAHGYQPGCLRVVLTTPWPKAEGIVAATLGVAPQAIWPSRYRPDGNPMSGRGERGRGRYKPSAVYNHANKQYNRNSDAGNVNIGAVN